MRASAKEAHALGGASHSEVTKSRSKAEARSSEAVSCRRKSIRDGREEGGSGTRSNGSRQLGSRVIQPRRVCMQERAFHEM